MTLQSNRIKIARLGQKNNIKIIPELDIPGHSKMILSSRSIFACDPENPGREYCLGNAEGKEFIKKLLDEVMELFPESKIIHVGGDEAETSAWEKCPKCLAAMKEKGFKNMRELENDFMVELANFVLSQGRTPMIWGPGIEQIYPAETIIQTWLNLRDTLRFHSHGNKVVHSVHSSLYFDYPANLNEYWESWMVELTEQGVYMTDPYFKWYEQLKDTVLGLEACLWTETAPQHRIMPKLFPRIFAYAESAWSQEENKNWNDYLRRKNKLEASGYLDFIKDI
jgi:hexosaminidase